MTEIAIQGLHHNAYRCRDAEETRRFYEDFLGLPLADAFEIMTTKTGRETHVLHVFFEMADGSFMAFFDDPETPFDFKEQRDFDLHIALKVDRAELDAMLAKGKAAGMEVRGPVDHGFIHSIYFRDPNGYVVELTTPVGDDGDAAKAKARANGLDALAGWNDRKAAH
ncbi:MAG: VOC family protein [Rhodospirillaceae bacterium]